MNDTPRTDESIYPMNGVDIVWPDFARQLERELNAANQIICQQQLLDEENLRLLDRIKRLEEAGDTMASAYRQICYDAYDDQQIDNWIKAKEAKP